MKVVVTGGAGFLGQRLIREVLQRGELTDSRGERRRVDQVVAVDQVGAPAQDRVRALVGDVGDVALIREAVLGADSVVGGSVFVTTSVPPGSRVALRPPDLTVRSKADAGDFVI